MYIINYIGYHLNLIIIALVAPMGYFAPIGEWLLLTFLALSNIIRFSLNPYKINYKDIILFFTICLIICSSTYFSIDTQRTLEVLGPQCGIIFAIFATLLLSKSEESAKIIKVLFLSTLVTSIIIFLDLNLNTEIRLYLAKLAGDMPTSKSANFSRGILLLTCLMPILIALLCNDKKYFSAIIILGIISAIIIMGPNDTAKITLILSILSSLIIFFFGPRSFLVFGVFASVVILFLPLITSNLASNITEYSKTVEYTVPCSDISDSDKKFIKNKNNNCVKAIPWQKTKFAESIIHRLLVWDFGGKEILKKPILGYGIGTSRLIGQNKILNIPHTKDEIKGGIPLHPHNNFLEIWLELGLIGIATFFIIWIKIIKYGYKLRANSYIIGTGICTSIINIFIICNLSFGFFQAWWISSIALSFFIMTQIGRKVT